MSVPKHIYPTPSDADLLSERDSEETELRYSLTEGLEFAALMNRARRAYEYELNGNQEEPPDEDAWPPDVLRDLIDYLNSK